MKKPENIIYNLKKSGKKCKETTKKNEVQTELSLQSRAHFANQVFQKCTEHDASFLTLWSGNRALATVLFTFCQQLLQIEARTNGNRDPTYFGPGSHISEKSQGFAPKRVLTNSGVSELLLCSCYVVDMMTGLPLGIRPWFGSFPTKLPLNIFTYGNILHAPTSIWKK